MGFPGRKIIYCIFVDSKLFLRSLMAAVGGGYRSWLVSIMLFLFLNGFFCNSTRLAGGEKEESTPLLCNFVVPCAKNVRTH